MGGGGTYILIGALMNGSTEIASGTLVSGTWSAPVIGFLNPGPSPGLIISGFGTDTKHIDLTDFYGVSTLSYIFASSEISASVTLSANGNGGFDGNVSEADLVNTPFDTSQQITGQPEPSTLLLLSIGLIGMTGYCRQHQRRQKAYGEQRAA